MNDGERCKVIVVEDDALLFIASGDGTVTMRAVQRITWDAFLKANEASGRSHLLADIVRRVVNEVDAAHPVRSETRARTAAG